MFAANTYLIRLATDEDADSLSRLAELCSREPFTGRALIGQVDGVPAAAICLADGSIIADPLRCTDHLRACLRTRAQALVAYEATPSLPMRMLAGLHSTNGANGTTQPGRKPQHRAAANGAAPHRRRRRQRQARKGAVAIS